MKYSEKNTRLRFMSGLLAIFTAMYFMADLFGGSFAENDEPSPTVEETVAAETLPESDESLTVNAEVTEDGDEPAETADAPEEGDEPAETADAPEEGDEPVETTDAPEEGGDP
ncbi:MAG: hypothetical protein NC237_04400, partial [Eubacterium sp.]|nr:hypothetical protein [Eubacterium sp.]